MSKLFRANSQLFFMLAVSMLPLKLNGQISIEKDTLKIREVVITRKQISSEQPGFKFFSLDSGFLNRYSHFFLNDVLRDATPLFIKEYGAGLSATSSFRGTSAGHTQVTWNGININDPMLGQTDFSLIPSGMIDNVMVSFGGASMDLGSGAIGGIINLGNEPSWKKETVIEMSPGIGSFGRYNGMLKIGAGTGNFQSVTKAFLNSAENNFRYSDNESGINPVWRKREHNQVLNENLMQEFYLRRSKNVLSARFWYQNTSRELPGSTLWGYAGEKQSDESMRSLISYDAVNGKTEFFTAAAWMYSDMRYKSYFDTIGTKNIVNSLILKGGMNFPLNGSTSIKVVLNDELNMVSSNSYAEDVNHNNTSLTLSAERKKGKWLGAALLVRETLDDKSFLIPDFSAGVEVRTIPGEEHYLKMNIARNSKIPSLNDLFWNPGGNPDLKNEYAYSLEAGYKLEHNLGSSLFIGSEFNYFNNYIRNMIQWQPDTSYIWTAGNIGSVNTSGLESSASVKYHSGSFSMDLSAGYAYTRARDISSEAGESVGQLIYVPKHQANGAFQVSYRNFYSSWVTHFTGRIYTTSDNLSSLSNHTINSFNGGVRVNFRENFADIRIRIENIFNVSYQTIEYYPQPGRSYFIALSIRFKP